LNRQERGQGHYLRDCRRQVSLGSGYMDLGGAYELAGDLPKAIEHYEKTMPLLQEFPQVPNFCKCITTRDRRRLTATFVLLESHTYTNQMAHCVHRHGRLTALHPRNSMEEHHPPPIPRQLHSSTCSQVLARPDTTPYPSMRTNIVYTSMPTHILCHRDWQLSRRWCRS